MQVIIPASTWQQWPATEMFKRAKEYVLDRGFVFPKASKPDLRCTCEIAKNGDWVHTSYKEKRPCLLTQF